jgi:hypothetical protein
MHIDDTRLTEIPAALLAIALAIGLLLASGGAIRAEWQAHSGWGPFPPPHPFPYPYPYPDNGIRAGVAAGVVGIAAGSVLNNVLNDPQQQPSAPPSSVYVTPPSIGTVSRPGPVIHTGSYGPATGAVRWDPDCNAPVAPSGVFVNGKQLGPTSCQ